MYVGTNLKKTLRLPFLPGGGLSWTGGTTCASGLSCVAQNPYYSQCLASSGNSGSSSPVVTIKTSSTIRLTATTTVSPVTRAASSTKSSATPSKTSSPSSGNGAVYKASFTHYGAGDTFGSPNCNTNTAACGFYTYPGYSAAASQNL